MPSVNALFTPDNWQTIYMQPAFYYQDYQYEIRSEQLWLYPTVGYAWKVRFAPNQVGPWQFKLSVQDAGGTSEVGPFTFTVVPSANKGFLRVSQADPRYFEFGDGSYFPAVGYNQPLSDALGDLPTLQQNGIQLIRMWLASELSIVGSAWSPWRSDNP